MEQGGQISGGGGAGGGWDSIYENDQSVKVLSIETAGKLYDYSNEITGAEWPSLRQIVSPCPTLKVIGAVTQGMVKREELKRMKEMGRPGMEALQESAGEAPKITKTKKAALVADTVASKVLGNTVGRVGRFLGKRVLGEVPDEAKTTQFYDSEGRPIGDSSIDEASAEKSSQAEETAASSSVTESEPVPIDEETMEAISDQLKKDAEAATKVHVDKEDEALFRELLDEKKEDSPSRVTAQ